MHPGRTAPSVSERRIPLSDLDYGPEEEEAVLRVLRSGWLSTGPEVAAFESEFIEMLGGGQAVAVSSGTAALHLALLAVGVSPGDEVIQPAINFVASANMTVAVGATPVFADIIGPEEPTVDPDAVERAITPRTSAILVMHHGGYIGHTAELADICRRRGLSLVEDACHAVGAVYTDPAGRSPHGKSAGLLGDISAFSFFSNKNMAVGEGGMVVTDQPELARRARLLRSHGMTSLSWDRDRGHASTYDVLEHGFNYRSDEIRAALGRAQLAKLPRNNSVRSELVATYSSQLESMPGWSVPFAHHQLGSAHHLMLVLAPDPESRDVAVRRLGAEGIQTSLHYPCIPAFTAFRDRDAAGLDHSWDFASRAITLPLHPSLPVEDLVEVCRVLRQLAVAAR